VEFSGSNDKDSSRSDSSKRRRYDGDKRHGAGGKEDEGEEPVTYLGAVACKSSDIDLHALYCKSTMMMTSNGQKTHWIIATIRGSKQTMRELCREFLDVFSTRVRHQSAKVAHEYSGG